MRGEILPLDFEAVKGGFAYWWGKGGGGGGHEFLECSNERDDESFEGDVVSLTTVELNWGSSGQRLPITRVLGATVRMQRCIVFVSVTIVDGYELRTR